MAGHPNVRSRAPGSADLTVRVLALAGDATLSWIEEELTHESITLQIARSVSHVISALVEDPPPRATILVCDFDALDAVQTMQLHQIRERGWFGSVIGLGRVPDPLRISLAIGGVLTPPYRTGVLRNAIARAGIGLATTKIPTTER
ncbi:MAG TPA: hypothetical protein VFQ65_11680 [Kofleriaceae bacterium]|nr:hypothetical protein [Kofleriaceae bacterium]